MPEGDTVWRTAHRLHEVFAGRPLTACDLRWPGLSTLDLTGRRTLEVVPRGKHLLHRLDDGWTIHSHLRMEGSWRIVRRPADPPRAAKVRAVVGTDAYLAIGWSLGMLDVVRTADEGVLVGHLGPDLLGPDWDEEEAVRRLTADPARPLGEALLDQRNLAGIGTIYRTELCFLTGYDPRSPVGVVADPLRMVRLAHRMLLQNRQLPQICTTGDKRRGHSLWIYGRGTERCLRCGTPVERGELGEQRRVAYWCPSCQPPR